MRSIRLPIYCCLLLASVSIQQVLVTPAAGLSSPRHSGYDEFHIPFITNAGQVDQEVAFYAGDRGGTVFVTRWGEIIYAISESKKSLALRESFVGNTGDDVRGVDPAETVVNHYSGADPANWREGLRTYRSVSLGRVYDLIDIRLVARKEGVEKLFVIHPGGVVSHIKGRFESASSLIKEKSGHLRVNSTQGRILFTPPKAFQIKNGKQVDVDVSYRVQDNEYGFTAGKYDPALPLFIDPLLASSYIGGSRNETTYAAGVYGVDIIVAGTADSEDFPGLDEKVNVLGDAFIVRLDPDLSTVLAATYFGGSVTDGIRDMVIHGDTIYAAGYNNSPNFPTTAGAAWSGTSLSGSFLARFEARSLRMTAATSFFPNVFSLAWSPSGGSVYVAGSTGNTDLPITGGSAPSYQATHRGGADSFIAAFNEELTALKGATFLGGEGFDIIYDMTIDDRGYPVVAGVTNSTMFPSSERAFDSTYNLKWGSSHQWIDGFVARLTPDLSGLEASTYIGGGSNDSITAVKTLGSSVLAGGNTNSSDFPCASTYGPVDGNDAFIVMLDGDLEEIKSCAVFGGSRPGTDSPESVSDLAIHPSGSVFATGRTNANDFPTTHGAFLSRPPGSYFGAFIIAFNEGLSVVEASTLIHGGSEDLKAIALDLWGDVIVAGDSSGGGYPVTPGAVQSEHRGGDDLVVSRLTPDLTGPHIEIVPRSLDFGHLPVGMEERQEVAVHNTGGSEMTITDVRLPPNASGAYRVDNPCFVIPAFGECSFDVVFKPPSTGSYAAELVIFSNDHLREQVIVDLQGEAIRASPANKGEDHFAVWDGNPSPEIDVLPDPCDFGQVKLGHRLFRTVRIINAGTGEIHLFDAALKQEPGGLFSIARDTCSGASLEPVQATRDKRVFCEIELTFAPVEAKRVQAALVLMFSDPAFRDHTVSVTGTGIEPDDRRYQGVWGWLAVLVLVLWIVLRLPVSASGWWRWMKKNSNK
jgi:hypothetical protein